MRLTTDTVHTVWDNRIEPVAEVAPGDVVEVELANASGGQLTSESTAADLTGLDFDRLNPVTGPLAVSGARPGDTLIVDILDIEVAGWGWTACLPGFGLLAEDFPEPYLTHAGIGNSTVQIFGLQLPSVPMIGTIGVAPEQDGVLPILPPHRFGGNMDIRDVAVGSRLRLPVGVPGARLSLGDAHAMMGDGEVCGTGVEVSATATLRVDVERGSAIQTAVIETDGRTARSGRSLVTTGIGPDMWQAARDATRSMIDQIGRRSGLAPVEAYLLASITADLRISEIVDLPNVVVSLHLPVEALG